MSALSTHTTARVAARAAAVILIGMGVLVAAGAQSDALGLPEYFALEAFVKWKE